MPTRDAPSNLSFTSSSGARKRPSKEKEWKKNVAKKQRNLGLQYESQKTKRNVEARKIGDPCNCQRKCFDIVGNINIENLFREYWASGDWDTQTAYLQKHTTFVAVKRRRTKARFPSTREHVATTKKTKFWLTRSHSFGDSKEVASRSFRGITSRTCSLPLSYDR